MPPGSVARYITILDAFSGLPPVGQLSDRSRPNFWVLPGTVQYDQTRAAVGSVSMLKPPTQPLSVSLSPKRSLSLRSWHTPFTMAAVE
jgi:hypothetical protein